MISNLDIERRKTGIDHDEFHNKIIDRKVTELQKYEAKILKSKKFTKFMEKLLRCYARGEEGCYLPFFVSKPFPYLAISKFNSYDLESTLIYDFTSRFLFFKRRIRL